MYRIILLASCLLLVTACAKKEEAKAPAAPAKAEAAAPAKAEAPAKPAEPAKPAAPTGEKPTDPTAIVDDGKVVTVQLEGTDQMKYNFTRIDVAAGRTVKLTLTHAGKMAKNVMGHNFVLLKKDTDVVAYATSAIAAKATDFIPADGADKVLAQTKLLGAGESDTIEFAAPEAGTYVFICTFPGHYTMMKGILVVE
jgi:azurin